MGLFLFFYPFLMDTALLVAKLVGPIYLLVFLTVLTQPKFLPDMCKDFGKSPSAMYMGSLMALIIGLLIVNYHNVWVKDWTVLVTIIGWLALLKGVVIMLAPKHMEKIMEKSCSPDMRWVVLALTLVLGGFFTYMGYMA